MTDKLLVLGASLLWIAFCMRFWFMIDRDNVWQRRLIAIGAGLGGGLIYLLGTMLIAALAQQRAEMPQESQGVRVEMRSAPAAAPK